MKWISVNDRLPKRNQRVIAYFPLLSTSPMDSLYDGQKFWVDGLDRTKAVTHWMPLPEPPTK